MSTKLHDVAAADGGGISVRPQAAAATVNGVGVDLLNSDGNVNALCSVGATTGSPTSFTVDFKLQESEDNSAFTDIAGATAAQVTAVNTDRRINTGPRAKRYVRAVATISFTGGTSPTVGVCAWVVQQKKTLGG